MNYLLFFAVLLVTSCTKNSGPNPNIANLALNSEITTIDPAGSFDSVSNHVSYQMYEGLYQYEYLKRPYSIEPLLATELPRIDKGGTRYTVKIKHDVRYHDGPWNKTKRTVKAQDFITQIKRIAYAPTRSTGWWLFKDKIKGLNEFREKAKSIDDLIKMEVAGLKAPDDYTLVIELTQPFPQLIYGMAMAFCAPVPAEAVRHYENQLSTEDVGTGPFYLESWQKSLEVKLKRFPHYRNEYYPKHGDRFAHAKGLLKDAGKKIPFLEGIHFKIMKESQTQWLNFLSKKIDTIEINKDHFDAALADNGDLDPELRKKGIQLFIAPTMTYWWLQFNMTDPVVGNNLNLRKAIAHAVDFDAFIKLLTNNVGQRANSIYMPGTPGYRPQAKLPFEYDLAKAKDYLAKAGYPNGEGLPEITFDVRGTSTRQRQQAEFVRKELAKIGINIRMNTNTFPAFLKRSRAGKLQFWQGGWIMDYPDSENVLQLLVSKNHPPGSNSSMFKDDKFDQLFEKLSILENGVEKFAIMDKMEAIIQRDLPWIMMFYEREYILLSERFHNYRKSDLNFNYLKYVRLK